MGESYISWLKLAQTYVLMGWRDSACNILTTASELYPNQWEVWRDLCIMSGHCKNFNKMIRCFHKLLDLKEYYSNIRLLVSLAKYLTLKKSGCALTNNMLRQEALGLFSRLLKRNPECPELWALFGLAEASSENLNDDDVEKSIYYLEKSVRLCLRDKHWYKKFNSVQQVLRSSQIIAEVYFSCYLIFRERIEMKHILKIIFIFLERIIGEVNGEYTDFITGLLKTEYKQGIEKLGELLNMFKNLVVNL